MITNKNVIDRLESLIIIAWITLKDIKLMYIYYLCLIHMQYT